MTQPRNSDSERPGPVQVAARVGLVLAGGIGLVALRKAARFFRRRTG